MFVAISKKPMTCELVFFYALSYPLSNEMVFLFLNLCVNKGRELAPKLQRMFACNKDAKHGIVSQNIHCLSAIIYSRLR